MSFISPEYALLLSSCLLAYAFLPRRGQNALILVASYYFYGSWDVRFLALLAFTTLVDFGISHRMQAAADAGDGRAKLRWLRTSLGMNLGVLGFFKYFNFFAKEAETALTGLGVQAHLTTLEVILPVGISFYTFQAMSYSIDVYRGELRPPRSLLDFATFVAFFPQLVAGPIERATHMIPQFQNARVVGAQHVREGLWLILIGCVRKVVIADSAAYFGDPMFNDPSGHDSLQLVCGLLLFALQIYGDFAGYSDIARGSARLFGFDLMRNFEHPYFARNPSDFWRRWHISLSTWLRDYLYIPLGGNRHGAARTYLNLMTTMLLGGLWHGASWNFVIWGGLHGAYLCVHRALRGVFGWIAARGVVFRAALLLSGWAVTFALVVFTWLFFRSTTIELTGTYLQGLARLEFGATSALLPVAALCLLTLAIDLPQALAREELRISRWPRLVRIPLVALMFALLLFSQDSGQPFIYFQF